MMKHETLIRQLDIIPLEILDTPVTVIGAGAIGSHVIKSLAHMGFRTLRVFDEDIVEPENLNCQGYPLAALGKPKVEALAAIVKEYTGIEIEAKRAMYETGRFDGVVVSAVDNMRTRRTIWEEHAKQALKTLCVIDPRMGAESAMMFTMNPMSPDDQKSYEKTLYSDEDALREPCTAKATMYTALLLSGFVCKAIKDVLTRSALYPRVVMWNIAKNSMESHGPRVLLTPSVEAVHPA